MKINKLFILFSLSLCASTISAQTVNVPFSTTAAGKKTPINWGMDTAGEGDKTVERGIAHYGAIFTTGRISFQPVDIVNEAYIDDASKNFGLSDRQVARLNHRISQIKKTGTNSVTINCDNEVLSVHVKDDGFCDGTEDFTGRDNYMSGRSSANTATRWKNLIKATVKYTQSKGMTVLSVAPFNEPDNGTWQYYNAKAGWPTVEDQQSYGMRDFLAIASAIKADDFFKTGAGKDVRVCGPNTLNCDRALPWYNYTGMAAVTDEGNTHQLAGSFDSYATFFKTIRDAGKVATADELHNVGEAIVGVEYGMQNAIWWHFDSKARGQFMHDSNEGVRLAYAENRGCWTSAVVYRNDKDGEIHGFVGSDERQTYVTTYKFQCEDREVYFNGYGPQREWTVTTVGEPVGGSNDYQGPNRPNYEYLFDITYGEDVQSAPVEGNYQLMNASNGMLATYMGENQDVTCKDQVNNNTQQWHIYADNVRNTGDVSYWFIDNVGVPTQHFNLRNGLLTPGAKVMTYNANHDAFEQWYLRYAKDGYFYIISRRSNAYMYCSGEDISLQPAPTKSTSANELKKYMWRLMPTDATAEQTAPSTPTDLAKGAVTSASVNLSWTAVTGESKAVTYNVLRQDANGWNTIARLQSGTTYTDTKVEAGKGYRYKVQAVDYSGNRSEASEAITIIVPEDESGETPTFTAGQWEWIGEASATGEYYLMNKSTKTFMKDNNTLNAEGTLWNLTNTGSGDNIQWTIKCKETTPHYLYINRTGKSASSLNASNFTAYCNGQNLTTSATLSNVFWVKGDANGYTFNSYVQYKDNTSWIGNNAASDDVYVGANNANLATGVQSNSSADTYKWLFISSDQYTKYALVSDYTTAFDTAKGCLTADLSSALKNELIQTLDDCDGTINYQNIEGYISRLNGIAEKCRNYTPIGEGEDFTGLIINPSIIQNGTTNDAPNGWKGATTNVTGNGHWTEGTGDTRLEAWNWSTNADALNVDYYQDVIVPNGLYTLTAVTHQRANGDAALYGETYRSFNTTMPVGDGNEAKTSVQSILVTDGILRIGIKATNDYTGDNQWATADNFTLIRVSTPEETALSHYTDAIAYIDALADVELLRYVNHEELAAARTAAHSCAQDANAYSTAINKYLAALKRAQALEENEEPDLAIDADMTSYIVNPTIQQNGGTNDAPNGWTATVNVTGNGHWTEGTGNTRLEAWHWAADLNADYNQVIENLPVGNYRLTAVTHQRENGNACLYAKVGSTEYSTKMPVGDGNEAVTIVDNIYVTEGTLQIGMKVSGAGNWVTADDFTLTYLGIPHTATLSCKAGRYGTFVAPFDVTLPDGIKAYTIESISGTTIGLQEVNNTITANTPIIVHNDTEGDISQDYSGVVTSLKDVVTDRSQHLVGFLQNDRIIPYNAYVLQTQDDKQAFYKVNSTFHGVANRCYLVMPEAQNNANVLRFGFDEDEETGIDEIEGVNFVIDGEGPNSEKTFFDLSGRKVNPASAKKGIFIVNGKKVVR